MEARAAEQIKEGSRRLRCRSACLEFTAMPRIRVCPAIVALFLFAIHAAAAPTAEIKVRDTSYYVGQAFSFYVHVAGVQTAPQPELGKSSDLLVREAGAAPSSRSNDQAFTFSYEAVPLKSGNVRIPGGSLTIDGEKIEIEAVEIEVGAPDETDKMEVGIELSQDTCFVGEPVEFTFSWITNLSLNGIRAVDIRIPALGDRRLRVREMMEAKGAAGEDKNRIGLPVSHQRTICRYTTVERNGEPAMKLQFRRLIVPKQSGEIELSVATLLCSYSKPRESEFKGTRYPEYFDNDFFDQDVVGEFERLVSKSKPIKLTVESLPSAGKPSDFSGIVGDFELTATAEPTIVSAYQPITLRLAATNLDYPSLFDLPQLTGQAAFGNFDIPGLRNRVEISKTGIVFAETIKAKYATVGAIPGMEFSYFDPESRSYGVARTSQIPLTVSVAESIGATDGVFSDGSKLRNEIAPAEGGIFHNRTGEQLLIAKQRKSWRTSIVGWGLFLITPPVLFGVVWILSRNSRLTRRNPEEARRRLAFRRFQRSLRGLKSEHEAADLSATIRRYIEERFEVAGSSTGETQLRQLLATHEIEGDEAESLVSLLAASDATKYSAHDFESKPWDRDRIAEALRKLESKASRASAVVVAVSLSLAGIGFSAGPAEVLADAERFFAEANEAATVDPAVADGLYKRAASLYESLDHEYDIQNGELFYNLGNIYYLNGDVGRSILNFRRAELYLPADKQLKSALRYVRTQRADLFAEEDWKSKLKKALFFHFYMSQSARVTTTLTLFGLIWGVAAIGLFTRGKWRKIVLISLSAVFLLAATSTAIHATRSPVKQAVILDFEVMPRKGDGQIYDPAFSNPVHGGAEVTIIDERRDWWRVRLEDGHTGWIPASSAERVALVDK
ncbi:MAG: hypothetical protein ACI8UO_001818 [Verrucomicrobiales bacterium]|jgi:hypothetical protein